MFKKQCHIFFRFRRYIVNILSLFTIYVRGVSIFSFHYVITEHKKPRLEYKTREKNLYELPTITYGCQTWSLRDKEFNKVEVCQNNIERSISGVTLDK